MCLKSNLMPTKKIPSHIFNSVEFKWFFDIFHLTLVKGAATDMIYFARSKCSWSLVHKKIFSLIWPAVFKLGYVFCQDRKDTSTDFEWTLRKVASDNNSWSIYKQAIIKLSLAYSFWKMFFSGQNLNHVYMTYSFLELSILFWLTQVDIYCLEFISHHIKEILYLNTNSKGNQS